MRRVTAARRRTEMPNPGNPPREHGRGSGASKGHRGALAGHVPRRAMVRFFSSGNQRSQGRGDRRPERESYCSVSWKPCTRKVNGKRTCRAQRSSDKQPCPIPRVGGGPMAFTTVWGRWQGAGGESIASRAIIEPATGFDTSAHGYHVRNTKRHITFKLIDAACRLAQASVAY